MLRLIDAGFTGRAFAMDRARAESAGKMEMGEALRTAAAVAGGAGSFGAALKRVAGLARTRGELAENDWTLHLTVEGATASIAEALIETAFGLMVAIPAVLAFNYLSSRIESVEMAIGSAASEFVDGLEHLHGHER